jgi:hypothetical protein
VRRKHLSRNQINLLIRILMVQLVLLPLFGSWFNKDFAALQPSHQHIFLEGIKPNHHAPGNRLTADHDDEAGEQSKGVVNLPDQAVSGLGLVFMLFLVSAAVSLPDGRSALQSTLSTIYIRLTGIFPPPLIRPPRI